MLLKELQDYIFKSQDVSFKALPRMVVLTKCDKVMPAGSHRVFEDAKVRKCKDKLMDIFGWRQQQIFPVINYVDDNNVNPQKDALLLGSYVSIVDTFIST